MSQREGIERVRVSVERDRGVFVCECEPERGDRKSESKCRTR